jgi:hypothetical protein
MAFIGTPLDTRNTFQSLVGKRFNGDGSTTDFTLDVAPGNVLDIEVFVGNVRQDPNSAYTLSGTIGIPDDTISARTLVTADSSADHVIIEDATDGELKKALYPSGFDVSSITGATALAAQPAADDEIVLSDAGTLKRLDIKHIQNTPAFHAYLGSNQTVANNTVTRINFNTELFDSDGCYDNSTNYRFTPGVAGKYFLYYQMKNNNQTDYIYSRIRKNNSDIQIETHYTGADVDDFARGFTIVDSDADDYFDIHLQQTKGSDQTVSSGAQNTFFGGFRIAGV